MTRPYPWLMVGGIFTGALITALLLMTLYDNGRVRQVKAERVPEHQLITNRIMKDMWYIRDTRLMGHVCIGYHWGNARHGGPAAMFTVPCEAIPADMLIVYKEGAK